MDTHEDTSANVPYLFSRFFNSSFKNNNRTLVVTHLKPNDNNRCTVPWQQTTLPCRPSFWMNLLVVVHACSMRLGIDISSSFFHAIHSAYRLERNAGWPTNTHDYIFFQYMHCVRTNTRSPEWHSSRPHETINPTNIHRTVHIQWMCLNVYKQIWLPFQIIFSRSKPWIKITVYKIKYMK